MSTLGWACTLALAASVDGDDASFMCRFVLAVGGSRLSPDLCESLPGMPTEIPLLLFRLSVEHSLQPARTAEVRS